MTAVLGVWLETGSHRGLLDASLTPPHPKKNQRVLGSER